MDLEESPWTTASYWRHKLFFIFFQLLSYTSLRLLLWLALCEGHVYCLWPLPCILLVCTTLVCVLFVATTTYTISVYCLWPLPHILLGCTTLECVLFVATTTYTIRVCTTLVCVLFVATPMYTISVYTISVYYFSMCTVCGHSHI